MASSDLAILVEHRLVAAHPQRELAALRALRAAADRGIEHRQSLRGKALVQASNEPHRAAVRWWRHRLGSDRVAVGLAPRVRGGGASRWRNAVIAGRRGIIVAPGPSSGRPRAPGATGSRSIGTHDRQLPRGRGEETRASRRLRCSCCVQGRRRRCVVEGLPAPPCRVRLVSGRLIAARKGVSDEPPHAR